MSMTKFRRWALLATIPALTGCAVGVASSAAHETRVVRGQTVNETTAAPWSTYIDFGDGICSGTLIDLTRVVTTAMCASSDGRETPAQNIVVVAGTTRAGVSAAPSVTQQIRAVSAVAVHPGRADRRYRLSTADTEGGVSFAYDLAVLTLREPFVQTAQVSPVALAEVTPGVGTRVALFGWGVPSFTADIGVLDVLRSTTSRTIRSSRCLDGHPSLLCMISPRSSPCGGDSGAGVVSDQTPRRLVGILSFYDGKCVTGQPSGAIGTTEPGVLSWLRGTPNPPLAPSAPRLARVVFADRARRVLTCRTPAWRGATSVRTVFVDNKTQRTLHSGSRRFRPRGADRRRNVHCASIASNAGGTTEVSSTNWIRVGVR